MNKPIPFRHQWTIAQFSTLCDNRITGHPRIESKVNFAENRHNGFICLYPKGIDTSNSDYLSIELYREDLMLNLTWECEISILSVNGDKIYTNDFAIMDRKLNCSVLRSPKYILREYLFSTGKALGSNDTLILYFEGWIKNTRNIAQNLMNNFFRIIPKNMKTATITTKDHFNPNLSIPSTKTFVLKWSIENLNNFLNNRKMSKDSYLEIPQFIDKMNDHKIKYYFWLEQCSLVPNVFSLITKVEIGVIGKMYFVFKYSLIDDKQNRFNIKSNVLVVDEGKSNELLYLINKKLLKVLASKNNLTIYCEITQVLDPINEENEMTTLNHLRILSCIYATTTDLQINEWTIDAKEALLERLNYAENLENEFDPTLIINNDQYNENITALSEYKFLIDFSESETSESVDESMIIENVVSDANGNTMNINENFKRIQESIGEIQLKLSSALCSVTHIYSFDNAHLKNVILNLNSQSNIENVNMSIGTNEQIVQKAIETIQLVCRQVDQTSLDIMLLKDTIDQINQSNETILPENQSVVFNCSNCTIEQESIRISIQEMQDSIEIMQQTLKQFEQSDVQIVESNQEILQNIDLLKQILDQLSCDIETIVSSNEHSNHTENQFDELVMIFTNQLDADSLMKPLIDDQEQIISDKSNELKVIHTEFTEIEQNKDNTLKLEDAFENLKINNQDNNLTIENVCEQSSIAKFVPSSEQPNSESVRSHYHNLFQTISDLLSTNRFSMYFVVFVGLALLRNRFIRK